MTDEEKAEEYSDNLDLVKERNLELKTNDDFIKQAYLDGLAEGEKIGKEKQWKATEKAQKKTSVRIKALEKENAELKKQIDQLSNDNYVLKTSFITQQEQIKKMKNCGNCNGIINGIRQEKCHFCMRSKLLSEWELAK